MYRMFFTYTMTYIRIIGHKPKVLYWKIWPTIQYASIGPILAYWMGGRIFQYRTEGLCPNNYIFSLIPSFLLKILIKISLSTWRIYIAHSGHIMEYSTYTRIFHDTSGKWKLETTKWQHRDDISNIGWY